MLAWMLVSILAMLLAVVGPAQATHQAPAQATHRALADRIVQTVVTRLGIMTDVAHAKFVSGGPIDDPAREAKSIDDFVARVLPMGVPRRLARSVIVDQFEAGKAVQRALIADWTSGRIAIPPAPPADLVTEVRPRIDAANTTLASELTELWSAPLPTDWALVLDDAARGRSSALPSGVTPAILSAALTTLRTPPGYPPAATLPDTVRGVAWTAIPTRARLVALTFDAGGDAGGVDSILRTLRKEGVPATFFLTGRWARQFPAEVARIARGGYVLGNHTDTHPSVTGLSDAQVRAQLRRTDQAVRAAAGRGTRPWFRFPYGAHTPRDIRRVNDLGYACIQWTVDTAGWLGTSEGQSVRGVVSRVTASMRPGAIVLMHVGANPNDGSTLDADALPTLIATLRSQGYGFTTLDALLR